MPAALLLQGQATTTTIELCNGLDHSYDYNGDCPNRLRNPARQLTSQDTPFFRARARSCDKPVCDGKTACADCRCPTGTVSSMVLYC